MKNFILLLLISHLFINNLLSQNVCSRGVNESQFFSMTSTTDSVNLRPSGAENGSDNSALRNLINNAPSGGRIINLIPSGNKKTFYFLAVDLKSNIHIRVHKNVTLKTDRSTLADDENAIMFKAGFNKQANNVSISSIGDEDDASERFKVRLRQLVPFSRNANRSSSPRLSGESFVEFSDVYNFKISNVRVYDNYSRLSSILLGLNSISSKKLNDLPRNGIVKNIKTTQGHGGYGLTQVQAGIGVLFKNLVGTGGITLRLETGAAAVILNSSMTLNGIYARGIECIDGKNVVALTPHNAHQGCVDISDIKSRGCKFAFGAGKGFKDDKELKLSKMNPDIRATFSNSQINNAKIGARPGHVLISKLNSEFGTFSSVKISDIKVWGGDKAQIKSKDYAFYTPAVKNMLVSKQYNLDSETKNAKSISAINYSADPKTDRCKCLGDNSMSENERMKLNGCYKIRVVGGPFLGRNSGLNVVKLKTNISTFFMNNSSNPTNRVKLVTSVHEDRLSGNSGANACGNSSKQQLDKSSLTFSSSDDDLEKIILYPNPNSGEFSIRAKIGSKISLFNSLGVAIKEFEAKEQLTKVILKDAAKGIYFAHIQHNDKIEIIKTIIK